MSTYQLQVCINQHERRGSIQFCLLQTATIKLVIMAGNKDVRLLRNEVLQEGNQQVEFEIGNLPKGMYQVKLSINSYDMLDIEHALFTI